MEPLTSGVSHVGLTVVDIEKTVSFFEAIGFKRVGGVPDYPSIFLSDGTTMLTVWKAKADLPNPFDRRKNAGLHHLAIKVSSLDALQKVHRIVSSMPEVKIEFKPNPIAGTPLTHMMCYEPSGVRIEFTHHAT